LLARTRDVLAGESRSIQIDGPLLEDEAAAVLREFVARKFRYKQDLFFSRF